MADLKYEPVSHDHEAFLKKAGKSEGFRKAYDDLDEESHCPRDAVCTLGSRSYARCCCGIDGNDKECRIAARIRGQACPVHRHLEEVCEGGGV